MAVRAQTHPCWYVSGYEREHDDLLPWRERGAHCPQTSLELCVRAVPRRGANHVLGLKGRSSRGSDPEAGAGTRRMPDSDALSEQERR